MQSNKKNMAKIYTKTGDGGETSLVGGSRITKSDFLLEVYGTCDELNAHIGVLIAEVEVPFLTEIQEELFVVGGILATPKEKIEKIWGDIFRDSFIEKIEKEIDLLSEILDPLPHFLLPQGARAIAQAHVCRTVCRNFERKIAAICEVNPSLITLLKLANRLSDYFFILARYLHKKNNISEKYLIFK